MSSEAQFLESERKAAGILRIMLEYFKTYMLDSKRAGGQKSFEVDQDNFIVLTWEKEGCRKF